MVSLRRRVWTTYARRLVGLLRLTSPAHLPYACSVCGNQVQAFLPLDASFLEIRKKYGNPYPPEDAETLNLNQYLCPRCGATDRDRLYALYIRRDLIDGLPPGGIAMLDIAPSQAMKAFLLTHPRIRYQSADRHMEDVDLVVDIMDMQAVPSETYDFFICSHVLEHVRDGRKALSELLRILKRGGKGILMVPIILSIDQIDEDPDVIDVAERWRRFGQDDHVRLYSKSGFCARVIEAGFRLHQLGIDHFGASAFRQYGISPGSVLYMVERA